MGVAVALLCLAAMAAALPASFDIAPVRSRPSLVRRADSDGTVMSELYTEPCRDVTFIFARGSTEWGNIGSDIGKPLSKALKARYGDSSVATQGVGYGAHLLTNLLPRGCSPTGINNMTAEINYAAQRCPNTQIVIGGYSQGAACTHAAVQYLDGPTIDRIAAAVLFGDTKYSQSGAKLGDVIDPARVKIFCASHDLVCDGLLIVDAAHVSYAADVPAALDFVSSWISQGNFTAGTNTTLPSNGTAY